MRKSFSVITLLVLFVLAVPFVSAQGPITDSNQRAEIRYMEGMIDHHQMAVDMAQDCLVKAETQEVHALCQNIIQVQGAEILLLRSWLLGWYNINYEPMSMMGQGCGMMQGGMMQGGMMGSMQGTPMPGDPHHPGTPQAGGMGNMPMQGTAEADGGMMGNMPMQGTPMPQGGMMDGMMGGMMQGGMMGECMPMQPGMMTTDPQMMGGMMAGLYALTGTDYEVAWLEAMIDHHDDAIHMSERLMPKVQHEELGTFAQGVIDAQSAEIEMMQTLIGTLQG
jgi:uncharacterized protein (DUF305 family)